MWRTQWLWFEMSPFETGCDELGAWIPTWALGRRFHNGLNVDRQPELRLSVISGILSSAFCATLFNYYNEVRPLLATLPFYDRIKELVAANELSLDSIHPLPPAELPNFLKGLKGQLRAGAPEGITELDSLGFMDAGANLNLPYVPLFRRDCDIILALDASADSQDLWFHRAAEYAEAAQLSRWPAIDPSSLFAEPTLPPSPTGSSSDSELARQTVKRAKEQEESRITDGSDDHRQSRQTDPAPPPVGSGPGPEAAAEGVNAQAEESGAEGVPEVDKAGEPKLGQCNM